MSKTAMAFSPEERAFEKALSGFFDCDVVKRRGEFDGVDGGGIYASTAVCPSGDRSFEASIIANPSWVGRGASLRLGWVYELTLWSADENGRELRQRSIKLGVEQGEALMRFERPAVMALATLGSLESVCAPYLPEIKEMAASARLKAELGKSVKKSAGVKAPRMAL